ncbi:MAG: hypothetical protein ACYCWW_15745 [Deltaproteobacteria bacterium]
MRRRSPPPSIEESLRQFEAMLRSKEGLLRLLAQLPPGSTLEDARRLHEKVKQQSRTPCSFLDGPLGIRRGRS